MVSRSNRIGLILLTSVYVFAGGLLILVLFAAATNAHIVWQVETELGHSLSCDEAYNYRAIDAYFYPERSFQGGVLYLFSLLAPCILIGFMLVAGAVGSTLYRRPQTILFKRMVWIMTSIGIVLFVAVLAYLPVIRTIGCAVE